MLSSSCCGEYRDTNTSAVKKRIPGTHLEEDTYKVDESKNGMPGQRIHLPAKDEIADEGGLAFAGASLLDADDKIHNALLEELCADYGVTDSTDIDLLTLDMPPADHSSSSPFEPVFMFEASKQQDYKKLTTTQLSKGELPQILIPVTQSDQNSNEAKVDISKAVASPTISSSCEEIHSSVKTDENCTDVYAAPMPSAINKFLGVSSLGAGSEKDDGDAALQCRAHLDSVGESDAVYGSKNHATTVVKRELDCNNPKSNASCGSADDDYSSVSSPSHLHVAKKRRIIACAGDLLEDVKESYEFVRGASIYSPASSQCPASASNFWPEPSVSNLHGYRNLGSGSLSVNEQLNVARTGRPSDRSSQPGDKQSQTFKPHGASVSSYNCSEVGSAHRSNLSMPARGDGATGWDESDMKQIQGCSSAVDSTNINCYSYSSSSGTMNSRKQLVGSSVQGVRDTFGQYGYSTSNKVPNDCSGLDQTLPSHSFDYAKNRPHSAVFQGSLPSCEEMVPFQTRQFGTVQDCEVPGDMPALNNQPCGLAGLPDNYACSTDQMKLATYRERCDQFSRGWNTNQATSYTENTAQLGVSCESANSGVMKVPQNDLSYMCEQDSAEPRSRADAYLVNNKNFGSTRHPNIIQYDSSKQMTMLPTATKSCATGLNEQCNFTHADVMQVVYPRHAIASTAKQKFLGEPSPASYGMNSVPKFSSHRDLGVSYLPYEPQKSGQSAADQSCRGFVRHLIGEGSGPYRCHPLFPLLRDLVIADMNFDSPSFPFPLLAGLPKSFDRLIENYFSSDRQAAARLGIDPSMDNIITDALRFAHSSLTDKIRCRKLKDGFRETTRPPVDDICAQFSQFGQQAAEQMFLQHCGNDSSDHRPWAGPSAEPVSQMQTGSFSLKPPQNGLRGQIPSINNRVTSVKQPFPIVEPYLKTQHSGVMSSTPGYQQRYCLQTSMTAQYNQSQSNYDSMSSFSEGSDYMASNEKTSKNKVLPNEAKAIMIEWLRAHQENPYPNDDEKEELMASTKLTISQINYWFTNARRRLLPKWAMQRRHAFEREAERHVAIPIQ